LRAFPLLPALLALAIATPAAAFDVPPRGEALLDRGRPYVDVRADDGHSASGLIRGVIDIAAPSEAVFATITDCALAPKMAADLKTCRIVDRDPAGRWDVREHVSRGGLVPAIRSLIRFDYDPPRRIGFHRVGGDLPVLEGSWRLEPRPDGDVRVFYENRVTAPFHVPAAIARIMLRRDVRTALLALRREALARPRT
jgi:hypothetical protein